MLTFTHLTRGNGGVSGSSYNTDSITPALGSFVIATVVGSSGTPGAFSGCSGAGVTWTKLYDKQSASGSSRWMTIFIGTGTGASGALTLTSSTSQGDAYWTVTQVTSSLNVTPKIFNNNYAVNDASGIHTSLTTTITAFGNTNDIAYGAFFWGQGATITVGSGFTSINEGQSSVEILSEYKQNDNTVDASWASANNWSMGFAAEITDNIGNSLFMGGGL